MTPELIENMEVAVFTFSLCWIGVMTIAGLIAWVNGWSIIDAYHKLMRHCDHRFDLTGYGTIYCRNCGAQK